MSNTSNDDNNSDYSESSYGYSTHSSYGQSIESRHYQFKKLPIIGGLSYSKQKYFGYVVLFICAIASVVIGYSLISDIKQDIDNKRFSSSLDEAIDNQLAFVGTLASNEMQPVTYNFSKTFSFLEDSLNNFDNQYSEEFKVGLNNLNTIYKKILGNNGIYAQLSLINKGIDDLIAMNESLMKSPEIERSGLALSLAKINNNLLLYKNSPYDKGRNGYLNDIKDRIKNIVAVKSSASELIKERVGNYNVFFNNIKSFEKTKGLETDLSVQLNQVKENFNLENSKDGSNVLMVLFWKMLIIVLLITLGLLFIGKINDNERKNKLVILDLERDKVESDTRIFEGVFEDFLKDKRERIETKITSNVLKPHAEAINRLFQQIDYEANTINSDIDFINQFYSDADSKLIKIESEVDDVISLTRTSNEKLQLVEKFYQKIFDLAEDIEKTNLKLKDKDESLMAMFEKLKIGMDGINNVSNKTKTRIDNIDNYSKTLNKVADNALLLSEKLTILALNFEIYISKTNIEDKRLLNELLSSIKNEVNTSSSLSKDTSAAVMGAFSNIKSIKDELTDLRDQANEFLDGLGTAASDFEKLNTIDNDNRERILSLCTENDNGVVKELVDENNKLIEKTKSIKQVDNIGKELKSAKDKVTHIKNILAPKGV